MEDNKIYDKVEVEFFNRKGKLHPVLCLPLSGGFAFKFGLSKAKTIIENLDEIKAFVEKYEKGGSDES